MLKQTKLSKAVAVMLCATFIGGFPLMYAEDEDLTNQLSGVEQQMGEQANKKANAEATIGSVNEQLRQIQVELDAAVNKLKSVQQQRLAVEKEIVKNEKQLAEAQARLKKREGIFSKRVRDIYINGRLSYLDVVIGAKDFSDFANRLEMLKRIIDADLKLIADIKAERETIEQQRAALEANKQKLVALEKEAQEEQAVIEKKKQERQVVLQRAMNDKAAAEEAYAELAAASANIKAMLQQREAERRAAAAAAAAAAAQQQSSGGSSGGGGGGYVQGTGQLSWPVNGVITSPFGWRTHPIWGTSILHSGIDIGVDEGTPVHAADGGVVVLSGWISGYGYAVIIDHGNGISTLYGHNSELAVSEGQTVSKGSVIAYAGSTGNSTGPHVHFEVRQNGEPVDPMGYL